MRLKIATGRVAVAGPRLRAAPSEGGVAAKHYQSAEHRAWRSAVLTRDGYRCVKCGAGGPGVRLTADHIREIADGGAPLDVCNGQTLCAAHANAKTAEARAERFGR